MSDPTSVSISVKGNREFTAIVRTIAQKHGTSVAQLVRDALDKSYGEDIARLSSFFEPSVASMQSSCDTGNDPVEVS